MELLDQISELLHTDAESVKIGREFCPQDVENALQKYGYGKVDQETNGWDVDFWIYFKKDQAQLTLSGSWYYGGQTLSKG